MTRQFLTAFVLAALIVPTAANAQYPFGKNKVIYENRDWKVLKTEHVDIYHYPSDANLILYVAPMVEETYLELSEVFGIDFGHRVPFVFYNTHYGFQETNILPYLISEYTGGFTDLMKGRIAVPFTGQYATFRHVARHEMVHAFMLEKLRQVMKQAGKHSYNYPPLWFVEGMAEYFAAYGQDARGNMFVRDALFHNRLLELEEIWRIEGSFMMYKQGEAVIEYIATNFGDDAVIQILENWWTAEKFPLVLQNTVGMDLRQLSASFQKYVKRRYYPSIMTREFATDNGEQLTRPHTFHSNGVGQIDENNELLVHSLCAKDGVLNVCELGVDDKGYGYEEIVVEGARNSGLESLPAFRSKLEAHGDTLLFVAKSKNRDRVYLWNLRKGKAFTHFSVPDLALLSSPTLSPDRRKVVFSAIDRDGKMDLFLYHLDTKQVDRLTDDGFSEEDPDYHPTQELLLFTSDRGSYGQKGRTHIYEMDMLTGEVTGKEGGRFADSDAEWAPNGRSFLFVSDREGAFNVYLNKGDMVVRQTNVIGGVNTPSFLPDGRSFVATTYTNGEFHLFEYPIRNSSKRVLAAQAPDSTTVSWQRSPYSEDDFETGDYETRMGIDFAGAGIAIDPESGDVGNGGSVVFSDLLGNHQVGVFAATTMEGNFDSFFKSFNAGATYLNRSHRVNYSLSMFTLNSQNLSTLDIGDRERRTGGALSLSYPLNRFQRLETSLVARQIERYFFDISLKKAYTASAFLTWVDDRTLWTIGGPLTGWRYYLTLGYTQDFQAQDLTHSSVQLDFRKYFRFTSRIVFATRFITRNLFGPDEDLVFYTGGPWTIRGYGFRDFFGRSTHLANAELRFPLIDSFKLGLPFGMIEMPMFRGSLFLDAGQAHRNRNPRWDIDWIGSAGAGVELNLGYAPVLRVNFARTLNFEEIFPGWHTSFFIGFNY